METVIYRNRCYEFVDINSKMGKFYQAAFAKHAHGNGRSLMDVYERPAIAKQESWTRLNLIHDFVTVTSYTCHFFTAMATDKGINAVFVYSGRHCYLVADKTDVYGAK